MSKSSGGFLTLQSLVDSGYEPLDYRYFLLGGHYRSQLQFSYPALDGARNARKSLGERIRFLAEKAGELPEEGPVPAGKAAEYLAAFDKALEDDLSTPRALAELWGLLRDSALSPGDALAAAFDMDRVLGLSLKDAAKDTGKEDPALAAEVEKLIAERGEAKKAKNYGRADEIRQSLKDRGIILEDSPSGTTWRRIR
jgi:cysteinyl-tRNA synthetase